MKFRAEPHWRAPEVPMAGRSWLKAKIDDDVKLPQIYSALRLIVHSIFSKHRTFTSRKVLKSESGGTIVRAGKSAGFDSAYLRGPGRQETSQL